MTLAWLNDICTTARSSSSIGYVCMYSTAARDRTVPRASDGDGRRMIDIDTKVWLE